MGLAGAAHKVFEAAQPVLVVLKHGGPHVAQVGADGAQVVEHGPGEVVEARLAPVEPVEDALLSDKRFAPSTTPCFLSVPCALATG